MRLTAGSAEERADVEAAYVTHSGDMDGILGTVLLCGAEDEPRFRAMLDPAIAEGRLPEFDKYAFDEKKTNKRKRKVRTFVNFIVVSMFAFSHPAYCYTAAESPYISLYYHSVLSHVFIASQFDSIFSVELFTVQKVALRSLN